MSADVDWPEINLPIAPPYAPMESKHVASLPVEEGWQFEPKWDGFRCLAFREDDQVVLQSKVGQPLTHYFPEIVDALRSLKARRFVVDGEIVVPVAKTFSFDRLKERIQPRESAIRKLAAATPALFLLFDLLVDTRGRALVDRPLLERRQALEDFARTHLVPNKQIRLSPATAQKWVVDKWQSQLRGRGIDGIMAKRLDLPYLPGARVTRRVKWVRSADCVVGGFRYAASGGVVGSLLLGLYDQDGLLDHVGFCSSVRPIDRPSLTRKLEALRREPGFTGRAPGGRYRRNARPTAKRRAEGREWVPVEPRLVVEVQYDHFSHGRFRYGTKLLRWRSDRPPRECTVAELERPKVKPHARVA